MNGFRRPNGGLLHLCPSVMQTITSHVQRSRKAPEAGGVLLGRLLLERPDVLVDSVTVPSKSDRQTRFSFFRARSPAQRHIDQAWRLSKGDQNYLGEWHTHPEAVPAPSTKDLKNWIRLARIAKFEQESLFFVIAGLESTCVWEVERGGHLITQLRLTDDRRRA